MSRSFLCTIFGLAMTAFSWYAPWTWPAAPAMTTLRLFYPGGAWQEMPNETRAIVLVVLIVINSGCWALAAASIWFVVRRVRSPRPTPSRS